MSRARLIPLLGLALACGGAPRPGTEGTGASGSAASGDAPSLAAADDAFLARIAATRGFERGAPTSIRFTPDGSEVLFLRSTADDPVSALHAVSVSSGEERVLATAERLVGSAEDAPTPEERARRERLRMTARGITSFELSSDGAKILVPVSGRLFVIDRASGSSRELATGEGPVDDAHISPDGASVAFVRDGDLYVVPAAGGREVRLTRTASETITNGLAEFVAQEEMGRYRGYWWSPDSRSIAYQETDVSGVEQLHILDAASPERPLAASAYPRAGRANAQVRLGVIPARGGATRWVEWDRAAFPYLADVTWSPEAPLALLVQNRLQNEERLLAVDPATLRTETILIERDAAWVNLDTSVPRWLPDGSAFLWSTERGGGLVLELRGRDGEERATLTPRDFGYQELLSVDAERGVAWVLASAEPTEQHVWRVPLDPSSGAPERMSDGSGLHDAVVRGESWAHTAELVTGELSITLRRGRDALGPLRSVAEQPPYVPRIELVTVGPHELRAVVVRPRAFEAGRRYPVLVAVYGGPHHRTARASPRRYFEEQWYADLGFIVVSADGRGTPGRGRDFERAIYRDVITGPLEDQVEALRLLGERFPEMDLGRVGIFGWSFGGYFAAHAVMQRPDVFHAAVAGAPVSDWRDYDTHYTERYMGLPDENAEGYARTSLLTYAPRLERPLLVVHGTADDNVYFMHSIKLSDAILRAGRTHAFLPLTGFTHVVAEPSVSVALHRQIAGFLVDQLDPAPLPVAPRQLGE